MARVAEHTEFGTKEEIQFAFLGTELEHVFEIPGNFDSEFRIELSQERYAEAISEIPLSMGEVAGPGCSRL